MFFHDINERRQNFPSSVNIIILRSHEVIILNTKGKHITRMVIYFNISTSTTFAIQKQIYVQNVDVLKQFIKLALRKYYGRKVCWLNVFHCVF